MEANHIPEDEEQVISPEPEPEPEPALVTISVDCGNPDCREHYDFPNMDPNTDGFKFTCGKCGGEIQWSRA